MRKSDKKFDNQLRKALTDLCENELEQIDGFRWLTHIVNYPNVQATLRIICVFDTNADLESYLSSDEKSVIESKITKLVSSLGIKLNNIDKQLEFDTEENCAASHNGNWAKRLK